MCVPDVTRPGEAHEARPSMSDQEVADLASGTWQKVHHARRQPGVHQQLDESGRDDRRQAGRLQNHGGCQ